MKISDYRISAFTVPTETPESDGTLEWNSTTMVLVELKAGDTWGFGYTYADQGVAHLIERLVKNFVLGQIAFDIPLLWKKLTAEIRNEGKFGISAMAVSAIDFALWDLKSKLLNVALTVLWGKCRNEIEGYGSGGFTSYTDTQLEEQMRGWQKKGFTKFKIKIGRVPKEDPARVKLLRNIISDSDELFVDANEALNVNQALKMAHELSKYNVTWFEQPISSLDLDGMTYLRERFPLGMNLTTGEYIYQPRQAAQIIRCKAADVIQLDVTRCLGPSGFFKAASICESFSVPVSTHCAPAQHVALGCAIPNMQHIEYFFDHSRIEDLFFEGIPAVTNGKLSTHEDRTGNGLTLKTANMERYRVL